MAPSPSRMARVEGPNSLRPRFRSRQARPSRATFDGEAPSLRVRHSRTTFDGEAHPSCDRLRGSLRSGDMSLRVHPRGDGALAIAHGTSGGSQFIAPTLSVATSATLPRDVRRRHDCGGHEKYDGEAHPSCDRLRGSLRSGDMSLRVHPRGDGALAIAHGTSGGSQFIAPTLSVATSATLPRDVRRRHDCGGHEKYDGEAHPSCDRLRGSLRSGDMSLRA